MDNDDNGDRPTLPELRAKQRPKVRRRQVDRVRERARFDAPAEHFFSNVETQPELVMDAAFIAKMSAANRPPLSTDEEAGAWWAEQRRRMHVRLVAILRAASVALLFASALR